MELRPVKLPKWAEDIIGLGLAIITAPIWAPLVAIIWTTEKLGPLLDPPGWRRVFAFWPVECHAWPEDGYSGWVWLETVWRNPQAPGFTPYRREAPAQKDPHHGR